MKASAAICFHYDFVDVPQRGYLKIKIIYPKIAQNQCVDVKHIKSAC